jgi:putative acetyltransferase
LGTFAALILIDAPVRGLRPLRAARLVTENVPNPTSVTEPPFFNDVLIDWITASSARPAAALERSACFATWSMSSDLFKLAPLF